MISIAIDKAVYLSLLVCSGQTSATGLARVASRRRKVYTGPANGGAEGFAMSAKNGAVSLLVLEGDGIGPEITAATLQVLRAADRAFALKSYL